MEILQKAMEWAKSHYPDSSLQHKAAFANSVQYLVTGASGGYGGPSLREHLCSWSLAGTNGLVSATNLAGEAITMLYPDGSLPMAGEWNFEKAVIHCAPLCFDDAHKHRAILIQIQEREYCFDDDPADLKELKKKYCLVCDRLLSIRAKRNYCSKHTNYDPQRRKQIKAIQKRRNQS